MSNKEQKNEMQHFCWNNNDAVCANDLSTKYKERGRMKRSMRRNM